MHTMILNPNDEIISIQEGNTYILKEDGSVLHCVVSGYRGYGCDTWAITKQTHKQIRQEKLDYENANNYGFGVLGIIVLCVLLLMPAIILYHWVRNA